MLLAEALLTDVGSGTGAVPFDPHISWVPIESE